MSDEIQHSFQITKKAMIMHNDYPQKAGLYAFCLSDKANLGIFGSSNQIIYIGIAKKSLQSRDFDQHYKNGQTGSSTLRRSLGAILKERLRLAAIVRGHKSNTKNADKYKFTDVGENALTEWMHDNLEIGYWVPELLLTYKDLRDKESAVTKHLKPTLDLDKRTRRYNSLAEELTRLRKVCVDEATKPQ